MSRARSLLEVLLERQGRTPIRPRPTLLAALCAVLSLVVLDPALAQQSPLAKEDLPVVMTAYVDSVVEQQQFLRACSGAEGARWTEGAAMLVASLRRAGLSEADATTVEARLAAGQQDGAAYDCASDISRRRVETQQSVDWFELNKGMLASVGLEIVVPGPERDARLAAVRAVFERHLPAQARLLNCMALVDPRWFPVAHADWDKVLVETANQLLTFGLAPVEVERLIAPVRSTTLMRPVADRQAEIAACVDDPTWMNRYAAFEWSTIAGDVREALTGARQ